MRVGTRLLEMSGQGCREDHPHACGDKLNSVKTRQC